MSPKLWPSLHALHCCMFLVPFLLHAAHKCDPSVGECTGYRGYCTLASRARISSRGIQEAVFQMLLNSEALKSRFLCVQMESFLFLQSAPELLRGEIVFKEHVCGVIRFRIKTKWGKLDICDISCSVEMCINFYRLKCYSFLHNHNCHQYLYLENRLSQLFQGYKICDIVIIISQTLMILLDVDYKFVIFSKFIFMCWLKMVTICLKWNAFLVLRLGSGINNGHEETFLVTE